MADTTSKLHMIGVFDDLPAVNFGNLPPLPEGYVVVWHEGTEQYFATKRGTDITLGGSWDRYWVRRCAFEYAGQHP